MKYIVEEEELKDFAIKCVNDDGVGELSINVRIQDLIQSKTPVEEIAEGEVSKLTNRVIEFSNKFFTDATETLFYKMIEPHQGKNIKIYIEVIK